MKHLAHKHILLGITGGIAAYKSADLVRRLRDTGAEVRVVMTRAAKAFITPLTLEAVSGNKVHHDLFDNDSAMAHIDLARWADAVLIAPASADFMARLGHGMADDLLATVCLATTAPIALAPAMNQQMWMNAATQANAQLLENRGVQLFGPGMGDQACGEIGPGRMLEPLELVERLAAVFTTGALTGTTIMVTAGPTLEAIDPVRFIGNRSSGRMGYAVAAAAQAAGARVILVSGPVALPSPAGVERISVRSGTEMHQAVLERAADTDIFIATAAVADYRPETPAGEKIKKDAERLSLSLVRNPDILAEVAALGHRPFCVGFAAETTDLEANARAKLARKNLDMIAANWVGDKAGALGFDSDDNALQVLWPEGGQQLGAAPKTLLAQQLINIIAARYHEKYPS